MIGARHQVAISRARCSESLQGIRWAAPANLGSGLSFLNESMGSEGGKDCLRAQGAVEPSPTFCEVTEGFALDFLGKFERPHSDGFWRNAIGRQACRQSIQGLGKNLADQVGDGFLKLTIHGLKRPKKRCPMLIKRLDDE